MNTDKLNPYQLLARWLSEFVADFPPRKGILRIVAAEPRFQTRDYFNRFKIVTAIFDGTGRNPADIECVVLEVSYTDQSAMLAPDTPCDSIRDL